MEELLKANSICKNYAGNNVVVDSVSLTIAAGSITVIKGKSGSGKSTLLNMLGGMEPPTSGKIYFQNEDLYNLNDSKQSLIRGSKFGFVFQSFHLIPELTVEDNIVLPFHFLKRPPHSSNGLVKELANELGIYNHLQKKPAYLSGGEQQRVAIARALITSPEILFADEPTGNLDDSTSDQIVNLLTNLSVQKKMALVVVTHDQNLFKDPDAEFIMSNGKLKTKETKHD